MPCLGRFFGGLKIWCKDIDQQVPLLLLGLIIIEAINTEPSVATKQIGCLLEIRLERASSTFAIQLLSRSKCRFLKGATCRFMPRK